MDVAFPLRFDGSGRTATTDRDRHIRDMIEQVLFTAPGERVNRPTFGCGLLQLVFEPNRDELAATTQYLVQSALQQWLGDVIEVERVSVAAYDSRLDVTVVYTVVGTEDEQTARFVAPGASQ
jgi:phage baseplate assembly protein W